MLKERQNVDIVNVNAQINGRCLLCNVYVCLSLSFGDDSNIGTVNEWNEGGKCITFYI